MKMRYRKYANNNGLTLPEMMIATLVFVVTFVSIFSSFVKCIELNDLSINSSSALNAIKNKISEIDDTNFSSILSSFDRTTFSDASLDGIGIVYVDIVNQDLLEITISFCFKQKNNRIIGEDLNLDGQLLSSEDTNLNNRIDSLVSIKTYKYRT